MKSNKNTFQAKGIKLQDLYFSYNIRRHLFVSFKKFILVKGFKIKNTGSSSNLLKNAI